MKNNEIITSLNFQDGTFLNEDENSLGMDGWYTAGKVLRDCSWQPNTSCNFYMKKIA